ncbi:MAG: carbohydrate porin [Planctomycetes bacterium]|nr:carbohydrate porin [Planctomycetota bacterium]
MIKINIFISIVMLISLAGISQAEENDIWHRETLAGDLFGSRSWLDGRRIILEMAYTGEIFSNLHGGLNTNSASEYRDLFDLILTADAEKFGLGPGSISIYAQLGNGTGITEDHVGDAQTLSNLDSCDFSQISEYWIEQLFFDRQLRVKAGKQDSNVDFVAVDNGGDFIGSSFAVIPTIPMPTFCDPGLGVAAFWEPEDWISLGAGFYEGSPKGSTSGFNTAFGNHGGSFTIGELALKTSFGAQKDLPGTYRFGGWYHSSDFDEVGDDADTDIFAGNHGFYLAFDQMLYHEQNDSDQGLGTFFQFGWTPENRNEIDRYFGAGLSYVGLLPGRDEDITGIGLAQALWSDRMDDVTRETAIELFYKAPLTEFMSIQPDIQYIANPSGNGDDALVFGVRFQIVF